VVQVAVEPMDSTGAWCCCSSERDEAGTQGVPGRLLEGNARGLRGNADCTKSYTPEGELLCCLPACTRLDAGVHTQQRRQSQQKTSSQNVLTLCCLHLRDSNSPHHAPFCFLCKWPASDLRTYKRCLLICLYTQFVMPSIHGVGGGAKGACRQRTRLPVCSLPSPLLRVCFPLQRTQWQHPFLSCGESSHNIASTCRARGVDEGPPPSPPPVQSYPALEVILTHLPFYTCTLQCVLLHSLKIADTSFASRVHYIT